MRNGRTAIGMLAATVVASRRAPCTTVALIALSMGPAALLLAVILDEDKITPADLFNDDQFGFAVDLDGDTAVVGARLDSDNGNFSGGAYIYERDGLGGWAETKKLVPSATDEGYQFGWAVAIHGDTVVVAAEEADNFDGSAGAAYVFERDQGGAGNWGEVKILLPTTPSGFPSAAQDFGFSVDVEGDDIVVGEPRTNDCNPVVAGELSNCGAVYVFGRNEGGANNWGLVQRMVATAPSEGEKLGNSVGVSGDTVVAGATESREFDGPGAVYVFSRNQGGADNWGELKRIVLTDGANGDDFGTAVDIDGDTLVVGARNYPFDNVAEQQGNGAAWVFQQNEGGANNWGLVQMLLPSDGLDEGNFGGRDGHGVAISGDLIAVGDWQDNTAPAAGGAAYVYERNMGGSDAWGEIDKAFASDGVASDNFAADVGLSGGTLIAGAASHDTPVPNGGAAYLFEHLVPSVDAAVAGGGFRTRKNVNSSRCTPDLPTALCVESVRIKVKNNGNMPIAIAYEVTSDLPTELSAACVGTTAVLAPKQTVTVVGCEVGYPAQLTYELTLTVAPVGFVGNDANPTNNVASATATVK